MFPVRFEPTILKSERPQNYIFGGAATGIGRLSFDTLKYGSNKYVRPALTLNSAIPRSYLAVHRHPHQQYGNGVCLKIKMLSKFLNT
jgi:hypothetical protein